MSSGKGGILWEEPGADPLSAANSHECGGLYCSEFMPFFTPPAGPEREPFSVATPLKVSRMGAYNGMFLSPIGHMV
jgi:hypothetical protein